MVETNENNTVVDKRLGLRLYIKQQPVMLALLAAFGVLFFLAVAGLSKAYHARREGLGERWFSRGVTDLNAKRYDGAVNEFRSALLYSRDNYDYQLNLAEALIGLKRTGEAYSYLVNLWDEEPENGVVNLELARIAAERAQTDQAQRYYHNAIYAVWPGNGEDRRRETRLELIEYLLNINARAQAQAELIALEENLGEDPVQQRRVGELFLQAQDYEHALAAYRSSLKVTRHNEAALAGAGWAALELGQYTVAERYLQAALAEDPGDVASAERLKATQLVLRMDPFRLGISAEERRRIVLEAFGIAGQRLSSCATSKGAAATTAGPSLAENWTKMKPRMSQQEMRRDPDLVENAMELVFEVERQTSATCGNASGADEALLLISQSHEVN
ncbi:MAG TPA: tetratricopeptide repeat protein [Candidatus Sulfotelmatobacter sp.]|nr:tetratricopeptide repeat protein [Candidatus Sulfotelmatobacter sp.]